MSARKKVTVVGGGMTGGAIAQRLVERNVADVVIQDDPQFAGTLHQGKALDETQAASWLGFEAKITGTDGWDETKGSDVVVVTAGAPAKARHVARRPPQGQRRHRRREGRGRREGFAQRRHHHLQQPHGRDVPRRPQGLRLPARARHRPGRRARHRPLPRLHRDGDRHLRPRRARLRPRRPHRHDDGARRLAGARRRPPAVVVPLAGQDRRARRPHDARRRRDRRADEGQQRLLRAFRGDDRDGRGDPPRRRSPHPERGTM